MYLRYC